MKILRNLGLTVILDLSLACSPKYQVKETQESPPENIKELSLKDLETIREDYTQGDNLVAVRCIDYLAKWVLTVPSNEIMEGEKSRSIAAISLNLSHLEYEAIGRRINENAIISKSGLVNRKSDGKKFICGKSTLALTELSPQLEEYVLTNYERRN